MTECFEDPEEFPARRGELRQICHFNVAPAGLSGTDEGKCETGSKVAAQGEVFTVVLTREIKYRIVSRPAVGDIYYVYDVVGGMRGSGAVGGGVVVDKSQPSHISYSSHSMQFTG